MFKVWWDIQLSFNYLFIAKFGGEKNKIGDCLAKLKTKRLIALCALFALQWSCLMINNWPDNLPMTNRNCFCFCYVTTQIIFDISVNKYELTRIFLQLFWVLRFTPQFAALSHWAFEHGNFWTRRFVQGNVATPVRCDGILKDDFIANLLMNLSVQ